jgi:heptosyltransferase-2
LSQFLIIQTAYIGDVVLASSVIEKVHNSYPAAKIDVIVRKGNEMLFEKHPFIRACYVWEKKKHKYKNLFRLIKTIRKYEYDYIINLQRYFSSGLLTIFAKGHTSIGFKKNPLSFLFSQSYPHIIGTAKNPVHEIERNHLLIKNITDSTVHKPKLYPSVEDIEMVSKYTKDIFVCIAPVSVWKTKQFPQHKWLELIKILESKYKIYLIGGNEDYNIAEDIRQQSSSSKVINLCGKLSYLQTAALMQNAKMNYVNDSAPLHFASAIDAPVTAIFCSTMPYFGFTPLSTSSKIVEIKYNLNCRPCGLHGRKVCPKKHFKCAEDIEIEQLLF